MSGSPNASKRTRHDGWTGERRCVFIEALAQAGKVSDACRAVGLSGQAAYKLRARDPAFAADWDAALSAHYAAALEARAARDARSPRRRRAYSPFRHLRYLDKLAGVIW